MKKIANKVIVYGYVQMDDLTLRPIHFIHINSEGDPVPYFAQSRDQMIECVEPKSAVVGWATWIGYTGVKLHQRQVKKKPPPSVTVDREVHAMMLLDSDDAAVIRKVFADKWFLSGVRNNDLALTDDENDLLMEIIARET